MDKDFDKVSDKFRTFASDKDWEELRDRLKEEKEDKYYNDAFSDDYYGYGE